MVQLSVVVVVVVVDCDQCSASDVLLDYLHEGISTHTGHMLNVVVVVATVCDGSCIGRVDHMQCN